MKSLAEVLRTRRTEIVSAWEHGTHDEDAYIPKLFDDLLASLEHFEGGDEARAGRKIASGLLSQRRGASIAAVLQELGQLRERIIEAALTGVAAGELRPDGVRFIHAALDECMRTAAVGMERAEAADRERFVAVLGHDLRTPLNAIKMAGAILLAADLADQQTSFAQKIVRAADRMNRMIGDLLDFAAVRAGTLVVDRKRCDIASVVGEVIDELRLAHADRLVAFDAEGDCTGAFDAPRMAQVVSNLISNAITYSPQSTPVLVRVRGVATVVEIEVHNEGSPIPGEERACIFTPFKRGDSKRKSGGLGLGLFIANEMVRAHGGSISLHSEEAEGTTFTVHVPRAA